MTSRHHETEVYTYLRDNYPSSVLTWVKGEDWQFRRVPLSKIKMARRPGGRNTDKVKAIAQAIRDGEKMDPVVLVQTSDGYKIADGYHRTLAFQHTGKRSIYAYVAIGEHDKGPWDEEMHAKKLNKGYGDGARTSSPLVTTPSHQSHADEFLLDWGAETHINAPQSVYNLYRKVMGHNAKDSVSVDMVDTDAHGGTYRVSDGTHTLRVYVPSDGPPRLLKALTTYTPTANTVWSILYHAGYDFHPRAGVGEYDGCHVSVAKNRVSVSGKHARDIFHLLINGMQNMQTSEDWIGGHQTLGHNGDKPKPW